VLHHHERWDGTGYPDRLAGERIPLGARIIFVADAFDAMTSDRVYRRRLDTAEALAELERCAGTQFDPAVVEAFRAVLATPRRHLRALAS
jgi:HD-GYP domain-containing protein (c-di-GMP phosphodiesterase class II)